MKGLGYILGVFSLFFLILGLVPCFEDVSRACILFSGVGYIINLFEINQSMNKYPLRMISFEGILYCSISIVGTLVIRWMYYRLFFVEPLILN